jgi:hypothetical protein
MPPALSFLHFHVASRQIWIINVAHIKFLLRAVLESSWWLERKHKLPLKLPAEWLMSFLGRGPKLSSNSHLTIAATKVKDHCSRHYSADMRTVRATLLFLFCFYSRIISECCGFSLEVLFLDWLIKNGCHCLAQTGLELLILLHQPPKCWNYRHVPLAVHLLIFWSSY